MSRSPTSAACAVLLAAAFPALAAADKPSQPGGRGQGGGQGQAHSKRCAKPTVAKGFVVAGAYGDAGTFDATENPDGTYTGSLSFTVVRTNHHAAGATAPFDFTAARVRFDSDVATAPDPSDEVRVIGKILVAKKRCTSDAAGQVTIRRIAFSTPAVDTPQARRT